MDAVLFDIDGTLVNTRGAGRAALEIAFAALSRDDGDAQIEMSGRTDRAIARDWLAAHGLEDSEENWRTLSRGYLEHLPATLCRRQGFVLPGVEELLETLTRRGDVQVGLLTGNMPDGARLKLEHFGIWRYFSFGAYGDAHLDRNAVADEALQQVQERASRPVAPGRVLVIGDTPHDVRCARHIGAVAVAVLTGWHTREELQAAGPDLLLDDLREGESVLDLLGR